jgi:4-hydroxy-tetrahydrodipicolinate synthase
MIVFCCNFAFQESIIEIRKMKNIFKGLGIALVTPFHDNGEVDYEALEKLITYQLSGGVDFLCVLGSTAETPCLTNAEKISIKDFTVEKVKGSVPILLGMGGNCTRALIDEIHDFDFKGVDGILSVCPYYNKPSQEGIFRHFKAVSEISNLPVVIYNVPGRTGDNITSETTLRIAQELDNVVAIKEASGKIDQIEEILKNKREDFDVISGDDSITYELLSIGAQGVISVVGNALPARFGKMVHEAMAGHFEKALPIHHQLAEIYKLLSVDGNPSGIKSLLSDMELCKNILRLPLVPATKGTKEALMKQYQQISI